MAARCWSIRAVLLAGLMPVLALPAATARVVARTPPWTVVRVEAWSAPARDIAAGLIGTNDVVGANRAYIGGLFERRNIESQPVGDGTATGRWPRARAPGAFDELADSDALTATSGGPGAQDVDSVQAPGVAGGTGEGSRVPTSVTGAMLVAGLGLLVMVARRRTQPRH